MRSSTDDGCYEYFLKAIIPVPLVEIVHRSPCIHSLVGRGSCSVRQSCHADGKLLGSKEQKRTYDGWSYLQNIILLIY